MLMDYLTQTVTWKRATGRNAFGEPIMEERTIRVRWEAKRRLVRNRQGEEVVSEARVFCLEAVQPGDLLEKDGRDWPVIAVSEVPDLDGRIVYREVAV